MKNAGKINQPPYLFLFLQRSGLFFFFPLDPLLFLFLSLLLLNELFLENANYVLKHRWINRFMYGNGYLKI